MTRRCGRRWPGTPPRGLRDPAGRHTSGHGCTRPPRHPAPCYCYCGERRTFTGTQLPLPIEAANA